jgi:hypothetical protein
VKTVAEIAKMFGVTPMGVRYWLKKGLRFSREKVIGIKPRIVIDPKDVFSFIGLSEKDQKRIGLGE